MVVFVLSPARMKSNAQTSHVIAAENCKWCGTCLKQVERRAVHFCDRNYAHNYLRHRSRHVKGMHDPVRSTAERLVYSANVPSRICVVCSAEFKPIHESKPQKYRSDPCYRAGARGAAPSLECECIECGTNFLAKIRWPPFAAKRAGDRARTG